MQENQDNLDKTGNDNDNLNWWEKPLDLSNELEQEEIIPFNPNDFTEEDGKGLKRFMNMPLLPHQHIADEIKLMVKAGLINPIETFVTLKRLEKVFKLTLDSQDGDKELREIIFNKVKSALDGGKKLEIFGATLSTRATGVNYDYSECNDSILNELYVIQNKVKDLITIRQNTLKAMFPESNQTKLSIPVNKLIQKGFPSLEFDDNEFEETVFPPIKRSGESVICTFKKEK